MREQGLVKTGSSAIELQLRSTEQDRPAPSRFPYCRHLRKSTALLALLLTALTAIFTVSLRYCDIGIARDYRKSARSPGYQSTACQNMSHRPHLTEPGICPEHIPDVGVWFELEALPAGNLNAFEYDLCMVRLTDCVRAAPWSSPYVLMHQTSPESSSYSNTRVNSTVFPQLMHTFKLVNDDHDHYGRHRESMFRWRLRQPTWQHFLWDDDSGSKLIELNLPEILPMYKSVSLSLRAEVVKVVVLWRFGGVWHDDLVESLASWEEFERELMRCVIAPRWQSHAQVFVYADDPQTRLPSTALIASTSHHTLLEEFFASLQHLREEAIAIHDGEALPAYRSHSQLHKVRLMFSANGLRDALLRFETRRGADDRVLSEASGHRLADGIVVKLSTDFVYPSIDISQRVLQKGALSNDLEQLRKASSEIKLGWQTSESAAEYKQALFYSDTLRAACDFEHVLFDADLCQSKGLRLYRGFPCHMPYNKQDCLPLHRHDFRHDIDVATKTSTRMGHVRQALSPESDVSGIPHTRPPRFPHLTLDWRKVLVNRSRAAA